MKKTFLFILLSFIIVLSSCKKTYDVKMNQDIKVTIQGYVYDQANTTPIANVTISWPSGSATTDVNGFFTIGGISPGSITLTFSADSFASMIETVLFELGSYSGNRYTETVIMYLPRLDQTLQTSVYEALGSLTKPAANVSYQIDLGTTFLNRILTGTTDANGHIVHANLPDTYIQLRVDFEKDGKKYGIDNYNGYIYGYPSTFSTDVFVAEITSLGSLFITASNILDDEGESVTDFIKSDNITIDFSVSIDLEYDYNIIELRNVNSTLVATDIAWSNDNTSLTIDPIGDSLEVEALYYVVLRLISEGGSYLNNYSGYQEFPFMVESQGGLTELDKVGTVVLTYPSTVVNYTNYIEITFPEVTGAEQYQVFGQYQQGEYLFLTNIYDYTIGDEEASGDMYLDNLPGIEVPAGGLFANGATYSIIVRAVDPYSEIYGPFSDPLVISAE